MAETKTCKQCSKEFVVTDDDLAFYKKISPTFAGKTFEIPAPTLCSRCRYQRRMVVRNVKNLHKRKCDLCQKEIVSMYSPDKMDIKIYCRECWWSDKWDPTDYAKEYNPNDSFFDQVIKLKKKVPMPALMHVNSENSDFVNFANDNKNCYLVFLAGNNEDVYYGYWSEYSKSCVEITYTNHSELCYEVIGGEDCYRVFYGRDINSCRDSYFIEDCQQCRDCILCSGLKNKQYYFENKSLSEEKYEEKKKQFLAKFEENLEKYKAKFEEIILQKPKRFAQVIKTENCSGDFIFRSKNCLDCFNLFECENCYHSQDLRQAKDSYDITGFGIPIELSYESQNIGLGSSRCNFVSFAYQLSDSYYCEHCYHASNLFGCIGMKSHEQYCILNKKYSREEYESLIVKIIEKMIQDDEWGEFFPAKCTIFGYNETMAFDYLPVSREEAIQLGYRWQEKNFDIDFKGPFYEPKPIDVYKNDKNERDNLLSGVLKCQKTGRPYKIIPHELLFYIKNDLQIPKIHYDVRMQERFNLRNPNILYHRQCMCEETGHNHEGQCKVEFETTYTPDRKERVYCEKCYQKSVI